MPKNIHELAIWLCKHEAGKYELTIAQAKEVLRVIADGGPEINELLWKYTKRRYGIKKGKTIKL